jgi:glycine hydroxymethyltransferase
MKQGFFQEDLKTHDAEVFDSIAKEKQRQSEHIELIASENFVSKAVLEAQGSIMTNKYAEGYPGRRYYGGCEFVDQAEDIARDRLKKIFNCRYANVQPHSGSQANEGVFLALLKPGDSILGMSLDAGGHLTHGAKVSMSGKWFNAQGYGVCKDTGVIDYDQVESLAREHKPKLIIAGGSAYPLIVDFARFREIADRVNAYLLVDMAHFAGLVAGGVYPSPFPYAHIVTSTTHKTLRGPRGGIILSDDLDIGKKLNSAIFPGLQGGPLMHVIAAKAVAFGEILQPAFKDYAKQIIKNAKVMADEFLKYGYDLVAGGTESHLLVVDLRNKKITGKDAQVSLEKANITCNKNAIPFDPEKPTVTSGIRLGSPAITTRGFKEDECIKLVSLMHELLEGLAKNGIDGNQLVEKAVRQQVIDLCKNFPMY